MESIAKIFFYIAAPAAAWMALFTWKRELKGISKHEASKNALQLVIEARSRLKTSQTRALFVGSRENKLACFEWIRGFLVKNYEASIQANIHMGGAYSKSLNELSEELLELHLLASDYEPFIENGSVENPRIEYLKKNKDIIEGRDDDFNARMSEIFSDIETKFKRYVR